MAAWEGVLPQELWKEKAREGPLMKFYEFSEKNEKTLLLVHGMATTWKMSFSSLIQEASKYYHLIVVALDGHNEGETDEFISLQEEAKKIEKYVHFYGLQHMLKCLKLSYSKIILGGVFYDNSL